MSISAISTNFVFKSGTCGQNFNSLLAKYRGVRPPVPVLPVILSQFSFSPFVKRQFDDLCLETLVPDADIYFIVERGMSFLHIPQTNRLL